MKGEDKKKANGNPEMNTAPLMSIQTPETSVMATSGRQHVANQYASRCQEDKSRESENIDNQVKIGSFHRSGVAGRQMPV